MWIEQVGEINEQLMLLGTRKTIMYLLKGDRYTLLGGGGQWIVPELERQFTQFQIDMDRVQYLVVGHTHYDHCGAVPICKIAIPTCRFWHRSRRQTFTIWKKPCATCAPSASR